MHGPQIFGITVAARCSRAAHCPPQLRTSATGMEERIPLLSVQKEPIAAVAVAISSEKGSLHGTPRRTKNQLGTLNGAFVPCRCGKKHGCIRTNVCSLTIMSAVLFLRLGWATGEAGFLATVGMLLIGETMTSLTALSLSAIVTNGASERHPVAQLQVHGLRRHLCAAWLTHTQATCMVAAATT